MASKTAIVNMALNHLGSTTTIGNIETDTSVDARAAKTVYDITLEATLSSNNWPFARVYAKPGLVSVDAEDRRQWTNAFRYPSDCLQIRRILPDATVETYPHIIRPTYEISVDSQGKLLLTNSEDIRIEYTKRTTNTELFSPLFTLAFSYHLAAILAPGLTGGDPFELAPKLIALYQDALTTAEVAALNEEQPQNATDDEVSEFTGARS